MPGRIDILKLGELSGDVLTGEKGWEIRSWDFAVKRCYRAPSKRPGDLPGNWAGRAFLDDDDRCLGMARLCQRNLNHAYLRGLSVAGTRYAKKTDSEASVGASTGHGQISMTTVKSIRAYRRNTKRTAR